MKTIGITGGTGFVGRHLQQQLLGKGYNLVIFTRHPHGVRAEQGVHYAYWDPEKGQCEQGALRDLSAVIHLAGAGVADQRWTEERKKEIVESRVLSTRFLTDRIREAAPSCTTFISVSGIGYYGPDRDGLPPFREEMPPYPDFLGEVCRQWEHEAHALDHHCRTVIFRIGVVLGREGGAFPQLYHPLKLGIKPILGPGSQVVSWIHVTDLAAMLVYALEHQQVQGTYNAVAEKPVTHRTLMNTIARIKGGWALPIPVPAAALKLVMGRMSSIVLDSCTVSNERIASAGFHYRFPALEEAVRDLV